MEYGKWVDVFRTINADKDLNESDVIEEIKKKLKEKDKDEYEKWEKDKFDVNYQFEGDDKFTLLHFAAGKGFEGIVKALLKKKADVNIQDKDGDTPLHRAIEISNNEIVEALLQNGADINAKGKYENTPLHEAVKRGNGDIVKALLAIGADVNAKNQGGGTPLYLACYAKYYNRDLIKVLLEKDANVNAAIPLHEATMHGDIDIVDTLIKKGADVNAKNQGGGTPLYLACCTIYYNKDLINVLLNNGAKIDATIPLHGAVIYGDTDIVNALIENGADINVKDNNGNTPLHSICDILYLQGSRIQKGYYLLKMVDFLITKGAATDAKNNRGEVSKYDNIMKLLEETKEEQPKKLDEEANNSSQDNKGTTHIVGKTESTSAITKGIFAGSATAMLGAAIAVALFATGTIAVGLIPIVIAVATIVAAALAVGYVMSKPGTEMNAVKEQLAEHGSQER